MQQRARQWLSTVPKETWHETAAGAKLRLVADYVPAAKPTTRTVVIAHGYMNTKESQADKIRLFHQLATTCWRQTTAAMASRKATTSATAGRIDSTT